MYAFQDTVFAEKASFEGDHCEGDTTMYAERAGGGSERRYRTNETACIKGAIGALCTGDFPLGSCVYTGSKAEDPGGGRKHKGSMLLFLLIQCLYVVALPEFLSYEEPVIYSFSRIQSHT